MREDDERLAAAHLGEEALELEWVGVHGCDDDAVDLRVGYATEGLPMRVLTIDLIVPMHTHTHARARVSRGGKTGEETRALGQR